MIIEGLLGQPNIMVSVTPEDLREFAQTIIEQTITRFSCSKEHEYEEYLTSNETAAKLGVSKNTLWRWYKIGYLCPIKVGRKSLYPLSAVKRILSINSASI